MKKKKKKVSLSSHASIPARSKRNSDKLKSAVAAVARTATVISHSESSQTGSGERDDVLLIHYRDLEPTN